MGGMEDIIIASVAMDIHWGIEVCTVMAEEGDEEKYSSWEFRSDDWNRERGEGNNSRQGHA